MKRRLTATSLALAMLAITGYASAQAPAITLVAVKTATPPNLAAGAGDAAWARATPVAIALSGGANFAGHGETTATLKAVYAGDMLYMLIQYADPTDSRQRGPFKKQADGSWKKLSDPDNKGGDDNVYYEDKWAFLWPIENSVKGFDQSGCAAMCHAGEGKPFGNKYTASAGEIADMWHMKGSRTAPLGNVDDQYTDHTRYDAKTSPNAGRKSDPGGPEYGNIEVVNGRPAVMSKDAKAAGAGGAYYIVKGNEVAFDDSKFRAGDEIASFVIFPLKDDRADIKVAARWNAGVHTSVISRKLVTGSKLDVQFRDLGAKYAFGFAAFDNAQVRHAVHFNPLYLTFAR